MGKASRRKPEQRASPRLRRAMGTNEAVERIIASTNRLSADLAGIPGANENVRRLRQGQPALWARTMVERYGADTVLAINDHVSRNAVMDIWRQQGRIAYDLNPELTAQLYRTSLKGKLPGGLFTRLPHISPLVPLPRPWPFRSNDGTPGLIRAYFVTGRVGREAFCPTTDPRSEGLGIMPWIEWSDTRGPDFYEDVATPLFVIPETEDPFTLDDVLDHTSAWHKARREGGEMKMVRQILPGFLSVLMYLCTDNRDMPAPAPPAAPRGKKRPAPPRDPFYVRVGWHVGPALHAERIRAQQERTRERPGVPGASGVEYGPQHRIGHYKTIHHGPGKSLYSFNWVKPYWTKREMLEAGTEPPTGVIPVEAQHKDPSSHRDVKLANLGRTRAEEIKARQEAREETWQW